MRAEQGVLQLCSAPGQEEAGRRVAAPAARHEAASAAVRREIPGASCARAGPPTGPSRLSENQPRPWQQDTRLEVSRQWAHATHGLEAATRSRATFLRIVFDGCPWTIAVRGAAGAPVTPSDVFRHLYLGCVLPSSARAGLILFCDRLAQPMSNTEWSLADDTRRRAIIKANLKRTGAATVQDVRRVDWLGKRTLFSSMRMCTSTERRWLSTDDYDGEVWVVDFENNQT